MAYSWAAGHMHWVAPLDKLQAGDASYLPAACLDDFDLRGLVRHTQLCPQAPKCRQSAAAAAAAAIHVVRELKDYTVHQGTIQELVHVVVVVIGGTMDEQHTVVAEEEEREGVGTRVHHKNLDFLAWVCYYCHSIYWDKHLEVRRTAVEA